MSAATWVAVAALGSAGSLARFLLDGAISTLAGRSQDAPSADRRRSRRSAIATAFPLGTLAVNASGALLLGLLDGVALSGDALTLAGSATLGSYTTFSTWMLETHRLGEDGRLLLGALNVLVSIAAGIGAALLGRTIGAAL